ncbi:MULTISPECIES: hypothetical protein [unclassified Nostoc]|uniref:hypothetical protein n=1 Tax=unclassified Nostoc TaxID=2593658 RepID=UPI002ADA6559|nr:hypothetical protein [Nostoc sp. DedQUE02]
MLGKLIPLGLSFDTTTSSVHRLAVIERLALSRVEVSRDSTSAQSKPGDIELDLI